MVCPTAVPVQKSEPAACTGSHSYSGSLLRVPTHAFCRLSLGRGTFFSVNSFCAHCHFIPQNIGIVGDKRIGKRSQLNLPASAGTRCPDGSIHHCVTSEEHCGKLFEAITKLERCENLECLFLVQRELWKVEGIGTPPLHNDESICRADWWLADGFAASVLAGVLPFLGGL